MHCSEHHHTHIHVHVHVHVYTATALHVHVHEKAQVHGRVIQGSDPRTAVRRLLFRGFISREYTTCLALYVNLHVHVYTQGAKVHQHSKSSIILQWSVNACIYICMRRGFESHLRCSAFSLEKSCLRVCAVSCCFYF